MLHKNHISFKTNKWQDEINVADFILTNYEEYLGDSSFLAFATLRTNKLREKANELFRQIKFLGYLKEMALISTLCLFFI